MHADALPSLPSRPRQASIRRQEASRKVLRLIQVPLVITRWSDARILAANQPCKTLLRRSVAIEEQSFLSLWHQQDELRYLLESANTESRDFSAQVDLKAVDLDPDLWISASVQFAKFGYKAALLWTLQDITRYKQLEQNFRSRATQQLAIAQLGQSALTGKSLSLLMDEAIQLATDNLGADQCYVLEVLPNDYTLLLKAGVGWVDGLVGKATIANHAQSHAGYTLAAQEPIAFDDLPVETRFSGSPLLHNHRVVSGVSVIITTRDQVFGLLGVFTTHTRQFTKDDIHFLQAIANVIATAIERKYADDQLRLMERAIAASSNGVVITDPSRPDNPIIYANDAIEKITGYQREDFVGQNCRFLQGQQSETDDLLTLKQAIQTHQECHVVLKNYRKDGQLFWNELYISPVFDEDGYLTNFVGIQTDITERKQREELIQQQKELLQTIFDHIPMMIILFDADGTIQIMNQAAETLLGWSIDDLQHIDLLTECYPDPLERTKVQHWMQHPQPGWRDFSTRVRDGSTIITTWSNIQLSNGVRIGIGQDITERKRMEEQLRHDALHDALTGLPNRTLFLDRLNQAIARRQRDKERLFAVLFLDLDRFKVINDSLGHSVGDQLLVAIAKRLHNCLRPGDTVARLGGDEFSLLLDNVDSISAVTQVADRIHKILQFPFYLNSYEVFTNASIGIKFSDDPTETPEDLLRDADTAMYRAKEQGNANHAVFDVTMYDRAVALLKLENDLRRALERQEFRVYYQPIVSLATGKISGFEALVRWQHPERGLVSPAEFIPVAEETGLIIPIGLWVMRESCRQLRQWQIEFADQNLSLTMAVNLSVKQFSQPYLLEQIDETLRETAIAPRFLKLEITESGIMGNAKVAAKLLQELKARSIQLCIDDFGTGYSSLSRLNEFPIDALKIDRSFVWKMGDVNDRARMVEVILMLAHTLDMTVVAEGVETEAQLHQLRKLGCDYGQGYLFAKPLNCHDTDELLRRSPQW